ncbi:TetR/AcrR family transcriptional regulator [Pedobacter hartonius]|uniref:Transcriptional regulator, TetR family n=1 Tax=Pedobacter hartonius TaxID=425514 RepID=A0A1H3WPV1_9SPHI|nr:TetR/AcrR family transcriptional regulator [Pedobacter hartonius]SDZ89163.1 transcriptional regulator, TetR family [Pedobacter hartonius]
MARNREFNEQFVIETATELFWTKGYNAVSTQDLINAFGISRSSMYAAYKDKKNLFIIALQHYIQTSAKAVIDELAKDKPFMEIISTILNLIADETIVDTKSKGCFIINTTIELAPHDNEILSIIEKQRENLVDALTLAIQKGIENEELSKSNNPKFLANYFYSIINGLRVDAKVSKDKQSYDQTIKLALKVIETA